MEAGSDGYFLLPFAAQFSISYRRMPHSMAYVYYPGIYGRTHCFAGIAQSALNPIKCVF